MKKYLFFTICGLGLIITSAFAQNSTGTLSESKTSEARMSDIDKSIKLKSKNNITVDESEVLNVTGISGSAFTVWNTADGTEKSYNHELRVVVSLNIAENKSQKYQLVFYSSGDKIPFAVGNDVTSFSVFYPISMYESIKQKLEQSLNAKKRVQLKVIRKSDGYREGTLIF
jgi:hypothetical protein